MRADNIKFSYNHLWKLMIDRDITNSDLMEISVISKNKFYKMKNEENITIDVLLKICTCFDVDIS